MSKVFYDKLLNLKELEVKINKLAESNEQKQELWEAVDSIVHYKVMDLILQKLQNDLHEEFIEEFTKKPHSHEHFDYLTKRVGEDMHAFLKLELERLCTVLIKELRDVIGDKK